MKMTVQSPAKINLFLDITGKRNDGYHLINTVMQSVSLSDDVTVALDQDGQGITLSCSRDDIPCDSSNTAYKAAEKFYEHTGLPMGGVNIKIKKRIAEIGEQVGADVPFCVYGGTMSAGGIGTILSPLPDMPSCEIVIVMPDFRISTKEAYERSDSIGYDEPKSMEPVSSAVCSGNVSGIAKALYNKFEEVADIREIDDIKSMMKQSGALGALMTGSGSAVFGIFDDEDKADECKSRLSEKYNEIFIVHPVPNGPSQIVHGRIIGSLLK